MWITHILQVYVTSTAIIALLASNHEATLDDIGKQISWTHCQLQHKQQLEIKQGYVHIQCEVLYSKDIQWGGVIARSRFPSNPPKRHPIAR